MGDYGNDLTNETNAANNDAIADPTNYNYGKDNDAATMAFRKAWRKTRNRLPNGASREIIAIVDPTLVESSYPADLSAAATVNQLTRTKFDTTTEPDRAVIKLTNSTGKDRLVVDMQVRGKRIWRYSGGAAELKSDDLKYDDRIRVEGVTVYEVSNNYIMNPTQVMQIADFWYKWCGKRKHVYQVTMKGFCPFFSMGELYDLTVNQAAGYMSEYFPQILVECYSCTSKRTSGHIGETVAVFREIETAWTKTTQYLARAYMAGDSRRASSRANHVRVMAVDSRSDGYDYICDGAADDVQIQKAIDRIYYGYGGGTVELSDGTFSADMYIVLRPNVKIIGQGLSTMIKRENIDHNTIFYYGGSDITGVIIEDMVLDGNSAALTFPGTTGGATLIYGSAGSEIKVQNVICQNLKVAASYAGALNAVGFYYCTNAISCKAQDISSNNTNTTNWTQAVGFHYSKQITGCVVKNITATGVGGGSAQAYAMGYNWCTFVSQCEAWTMTASGAINNYGVGFNQSASLNNNKSDNSAANSVGFKDCTWCQQNRSINNVTKYTNSFADAGVNACAATAAGGYNASV